jgi:hypothetical protein
MVWTGATWLRIGTSGGLLWMPSWTFECLEMLASSWVAAQLAASQEELSSVSKYFFTETTIIHQDESFFVSKFTHHERFGRNGLFSSDTSVPNFVNLSINNFSHVASIGRISHIAYILNDAPISRNGLGHTFHVPAQKNLHWDFRNNICCSWWLNLTFLGSWNYACRFSDLI